MLTQMAHIPKKSLGSNTLSRSPQSILKKKGTPSTEIQLSISTLRRGRDREKAHQKDQKLIRNQNKQHRALIELRGNPLLTIKRRKFG
jgi:hypothetical protein